MKYTKVALKPYLDAITGYCDSLSKKELTDAIMSMAKEVPVNGRVDFLNKFKSYLPGKSPIRLPDDNPVEQILNDIEALKESIKERIESIEDGSYWDHSDHWDRESDYDEEPDYISEEQADELEAFFDEAGDFFMGDQLELSRKFYEALFKLIREFNESVDSSPYFEIDLREARARYCRCIYETSDQDKMIDEFMDAMNVDASVKYRENEYPEDYPLLQDVIDARAQEMKDLEAFLPLWKRALAEKGTKGRPAVLLLETVNRLEGIDGVAHLARKWKNAQPQGYVYWLNILKQNNDWQGMLALSSEALDALDKGSFREQAAEFMIHAAEMLKSPQSVLAGKRERFFSNVDDQNLLWLVDEAVHQNVRDEQLKTVVDFSKARQLKTEEESLYIKVLLMAGNLHDPFDMVKSDKGVGWSYGSNAGVVFGAVASVLSGYLQTTTTITKILKTYADDRSVYSGKITVDSDNGATFYKEIIKGLKQAAHTKTERSEYFEWAEKTGRKRIEHIVSNKHRGAYDRAAQVLCALAEVYTAIGETGKAIKLLHTYYNEKYNRHSAFRNEVKIVLKSSDLLRDIGFSV